MAAMQRQMGFEAMTVIQVDVLAVLETQLQESAYLKISITGDVLFLKMYPFDVNFE